MDKAISESAIHEIYEYFDRKDPSYEKKRAVFKLIEFIPNEAVDWIKAKMQDELDSLPRNIGKAFKMNYQAWLSSHSGKVAVYQPTKCKDCKGHGLLWYSIFSEKMGYRYQEVCICGSCDNWRKLYNNIDNENVMTLASLIDLGCRLEGPTKDLPTVAERKPVKDMAKGIGTSITDMPLEREPTYCCEQVKSGGHTDECPNNIKNLPLLDDAPDYDDDIPF